MHITAAYSVFRRLIFSSSFKSFNNRQSKWVFSTALA